jgi:hypothetical protein
VGESETDDELDQAAEEVETKSSAIVEKTRKAYGFRIHYMRERAFMRLKEDKHELRKQLARLGIRTLRPVDVAWNYVIFYNEKIRHLWADCNKRDPEERGHVMRQIADLNQKRQQRLAEVDQLPDCPVMFWEFHGWVEAEYREALRTLESETIEQPELVVAQPSPTNAGFLDHVTGGSEPIGDYDVPKADLNPMSSFEPFELAGKTSFDTAFENMTSSQEYDADRPSLDAFGKSLFPTQSHLESGEVMNHDDDDSLFGDSDYQLDLAPISCQAVEEANISENASHASPIAQQQASPEEKVIENNNSDSVFSVPDGVSQLEPAAAPGQAAQEPLLCGNNTIANASVNKQVSHEQQTVEGYTEDNDSPFGGEAEETDGAIAEPVEQAALGPQEAQQIADQSDMADSEPGPPPFVPGELPKVYVPTFESLAESIDKDGLQQLRGIARKELCRFWPDGRQDCSDRQLDIYATGTKEFKKDELTRYEECQKVGKAYVIEFEEEYDEIPPHLTLKTIFNGIALFHCLIADEPEVVDLTGDDSIPSATAAPLGVPEPALAAPAEIVAAREPVPATADGGVLNTDEAPKEADKAGKGLERIPNPPPVDQATFTQGPVQLAGNTEPTTPVQDGPVRNDGTWSSGWSEKAFSDGGVPPRTPSNQEVVVMERSVSADNTMRKTSTPEKAVRTKKARAKARTGAGPGPLSSTQGAHAALQNQLSQSDQTAGNVHAPSSAALGPVAGSSTTETAERGTKRRKKNAKAAADADTSQQRTTPEQQPAQYYEPSPEQRVNAKKWVEDHTQGGKGKKTQKRKSLEPKTTPTPRKARKTDEETPVAPRSYRNIAPAPARNHNDANDGQMQSRASTPMGHNGATYSSPDVQMTGNGPQMHPAAPQMPHGRRQQMPRAMTQESFQNAPRPQYFQPPVGPQNVWVNPMQQQSSWQAGTNSLQERRMRLEQEIKDLEQQELMAENDRKMAEKDRKIAELEQRLSQQHPAESSQMVPNHSMPQGHWQSLQQGNWPPPQQGNVQPQSHGETGEEYLQFKKFPQQMSQPSMTTPQMMPSQRIPPNGMAPYPTNMHGGYWQASPAAGHPMAMNFPQNGYPAPMNFSQSVQGANGHGMHGGFNGGAGGDHMEGSMPGFGY